MRPNSITKRIKSKLLGKSPNIPESKHLILTKTKWYNNADSPVCLMIDDLTNGWVIKNSADIDGPAYDWGGKHNKVNSATTYLNQKLLQRFPHIKTDYFTVVGKMNSFNTQSSFAFAEPIDFNKEALNYFRTLGLSINSEIAYHGMHHGIPRKLSKDYIQEWESFDSLAQGVKKIEKGKNIYKRVFGQFPTGGKYGGYKANHLSDSTIEESGFLWWCRDWKPRDISGEIDPGHYELEYFGEKRKVVSIPSTVHGRNWNKKQLDILLNNKQIISVQEHISPRRPDGKIQTPNIYDDIKSLYKLFSYLEDKNVWHATCTEIARYFIGFTNSIFYDLRKDSFRVEYSGEIADPIISVILSADCLCDSEKPFLRVSLPGGQTLSGNHIKTFKKNYKFLIDLPLRNGKYRLTATAKPEKKLDATVTDSDSLNFNEHNMAGVVRVPIGKFEGFYPFPVNSHGICDVNYDESGCAVFYCNNSSNNYHLTSLNNLDTRQSNERI
jgi:hypothetical protein